MEKLGFCVRSQQPWYGQFMPKIAQTIGPIPFLSPQTYAQDSLRLNTSDDLRIERLLSNGTWKMVFGVPNTLLFFRLLKSRTPA